ncbi:hypothetical protein DHW03_00310 [Pedobacter yonginense]|uniref:Uncharacterized protein n=1 Tax=Pedobacter yonginense TaxID=651869 RepID=A0A317EPQ2_9SPHI|nr:hypothetical protein [Pedobacter yonginense]PWS28335.1 hypothetical protein DHW03_00310 [Pedobacter yonginense]
MKNKFYLWATLLAIPVIIFIVILIKDRKKSSATSNDEEVYQPVTPRTLHGVDTIRAADSLYIINFTVKKVIPDTIDCESQNKYDRNDLTTNFSH